MFLELHDPAEASLESTGNGGNLCQPGGEELLEQKDGVYTACPHLSHAVNNSVCVWKAERVTGRVVYMHAY